MWCWDCNKILTTTFKEEGRNLKIFDYETNIIWFLYLYTFIGSVIKHGGAKKFKFYWRFRHSTCIKMFHIVDCVSSWLYKHTIYTNVDEIITLRTNQCKRRITFYRQELIFISNAQSSCLWWIISDRDTFSKTHFKNFTLQGKIHKEMRTEVLNKTASAWLLKIVMILIPLQALECFWWASICKFFGGGLLLQEFANACSSMAFCRCGQDHQKFSKSCWGPSDQSSAVFSEIYNPTYFVYLASTLNAFTFSCLECWTINL